MFHYAIRIRIRNIRSLVLFGVWCCIPDVGYSGLTIIYDFCLPSRGTLNRILEIYVLHEMWHRFPLINSRNIKHICRVSMLRQQAHRKHGTAGGLSPRQRRLDGVETNCRSIYSLSAPVSAIARALSLCCSLSRRHKSGRGNHDDDDDDDALSLGWPAALPAAAFCEPGATICYGEMFRMARRKLIGCGRRRLP